MALKRSRAYSRSWPSVNSPSVRSPRQRATAVDPKATCPIRQLAAGPWHDERLASAKLFSRERGGATSATLHWEIVMESETASNRREPWNKGKLVGQKAPFKSKEIWAIRVRLQMAERARELALFNLGIDSKLRACDLTALRVRDICPWRPGFVPSNRVAAQNAAASAVRDHDAGAGGGANLDPEGRTPIGRFPFSEPPQSP